MSNQKECLCLNCIYGGQPYGYFPFVCVHGKRVKEIYHEVFNCKHFERCPEPIEPPKMKPWQVIITEKGMSKDYKHLKELLDHGEKVVVLVQILPPGNRKHHILATTGIDKGRKYYSIGYGYVFTDEAFFRQCEALELEYIELRGQ